MGFLEICPPSIPFHSRVEEKIEYVDVEVEPVIVCIYTLGCCIMVC